MAGGSRNRFSVVNSQRFGNPDHSRNRALILDVFGQEARGGSTSVNRSAAGLIALPGPGL